MQEIQSLYVHFPFCKHLCNYCDFYKNVLERPAQVTSFEELLVKQFEENQLLLEKKDFTLAPLKSLYIGGGTPSLWGKQGPRFIEKLKNKGLQFDPNIEFTIEIDPDTFVEEEIEEWEKVGVNRFSFGVQAMNDSCLELLDRTHRKKHIEALLNYSHRKNKNFSVDLLIGIPTQVSRDLKQEIDDLLSYNPSHLSVYILKTRKNYPHHLTLPDDDATADEYLFVCDYLKSAGYEQYEVSNFAKDQKYSFHNQQYWKYESVAAIGASATGLMSLGNKAIRYQWKSSKAEYLLEEIEDSALVIEKLFLMFRTKDGIDLDGIFKKNEDRQLLDQLYVTWGERGYLADTSSRTQVVLSPKGLLMSDSILDDIFREISF